MSYLSLLNGLLSVARSGDLELPLLKKYPLGGDFGGSMFTDGVSWGDDCVSIDTGRLCSDFGGDIARRLDNPGVRGNGETISVDLSHEVCVRGMSTDARD